MKDIVFKINQATQISTQNLCNTCRCCRKSQSATSGKLILICDANYSAPQKLVEPISQCNRYSDSRIPTLDEMKEIAWQLMTDKGGRRIGFQSPEESRKFTRTGF